MSKEFCPRCGHVKFWNIRRRRNRCTRCRYEWKPGFPLNLSRVQWESLLESYLSLESTAAVAKHCKLNRQKVLRAVKLVQDRLQAASVQEEGALSFNRNGFHSLYGAHWIGVLFNDGRVWANLVSSLKTAQEAAEKIAATHRFRVVCSDYFHFSSKVSPQNMAVSLLNGKNGEQRCALRGLMGFWMFLKRHEKEIKRQPKSLPLYGQVAYWTWRFNSRFWTTQQRVHRLIRLLELSKGNLKGARA